MEDFNIINEKENYKIVTSGVTTTDNPLNNKPIFYIQKDIEEIKKDIEEIRNMLLKLMPPTKTGWG